MGLVPMSVAWTVDAVKNRRKTVTRRRIDKWETLQPGDKLVLVNKTKGFKKTERLEIYGLVEVVDVRVESIFLLGEGEYAENEILLEGFDLEADWKLDKPRWSGDPWLWMCWWLESNQYVHRWDDDWGPFWMPVKGPRRPLDDILCRRVEWRYLD